jgi:hypothetical protein
MDEYKNVTSLITHYFTKSKGNHYPYMIDFEALFRMSCGDRERARDILKKVLTSHYTNVENRVKSEHFNSAFDCVLAELFNDGIEIEWIS